MLDLFVSIAEHHAMFPRIKGVESEEVFWSLIYGSNLLPLKYLGLQKKLIFSKHKFNLEKSIF
jgi:hypothetical protein